MKKIHTIRVNRILAVCLSLLAAPVLVSAQNAKPVTLTALFGDVNANWANMNDDVGKVITAKTGVTLQAEFAVGDLNQKFNLVAASGQYPDLIAPKGAQGVLVDAGAMLDLTDLINKYAPNIKKVIGNQYDRMRFSSKDPKIYFIPDNSAIGQIDFDTDSWFKVQLAALKESGYPLVKTLADYEKVIAAYVKKHPTTADGKPTVGLSLLADDWRFVITVTNPAFWATGTADDGEWYIDPKTYKAYPHVLRPEEKEYFRWLNHMNAIGLIDPESFTQKYDQYLAKIATGRVVGIIDAKWETDDAINSLKAAGKFDQTYGRFGAVLKPGVKAAYNAPTGFRGDYGIGISSTCKDPVAAIKFLDFLASEEGQILVNWGIQGKHYNIVGGKRVIPADVLNQKINDQNTFKRTTGIGSYNKISINYGDGVKDSTGNYITTNYPELLLAAYSEPEKAALKAYKVTFWNDLLPKPSEFKPIPWAAAWAIAIPQDSKLTDFWNKEQDITRKYIPKAILGTPADFDKTYDEMVQKLKDSCGDLFDAETQLVQDRLKLWGYLK